MVKLPKLKVEGLGWEAFSGTHDFEKARYFPFGQNVVIAVEDEYFVQSYEDLVYLAERPELRERDYLNIKFFEIIVGG